MRQTKYPDFDLYEFLGVAQTASADEIRRAYRKLARDQERQRLSREW